MNDAVYIAKYADSEVCERLYGYIPGDNKKKGGQWTATGTQFQIPYVFKRLFSKEDLVFEDLFVTKSVTSTLYLDMNEGMGEDEHNYIFIGKVGQFCPIKPGCGGGVLYREKDGKYYAATGTKGYRWLESEMVMEMNKMHDIDESHFIAMADDAIEAIKKHGDYDWFVSDEPYLK